MSKTYGLELILRAGNNYENIYKILLKGTQKGFIYYDHGGKELAQNSPLLTPQEALRKLKRVKEFSEDDDQSLCVGFDQDCLANVWFKEDDEGLLKVYFSAFGNQKYKIVDDVEQIDFLFYIKIGLEACEDFYIEKIVFDYF